MVYSNDNRKSTQSQRQTLQGEEKETGEGEETQTFGRREMKTKGNVL